jgi:hypothetical protein
MATDDLLVFLNSEILGGSWQVAGKENGDVLGHQ